MLLVIFDHQGTVHYEFAPEDQTINQDLYLEVLRYLRNAVQRKGPEMWTAGSWLFHHNSALAHTALSVRQFLAKHPIPTIPQPPYSPHLSPPDFFLFLKLKITLKRRRFQTVEYIIANATNYFKAIPQTPFEQCFQKWKRRREKCIAAHGDYFDGDNIQ
jgi:transposase